MCLKTKTRRLGLPLTRAPTLVKGYRFFTIVDGLDASKFTLKGRELTFKATAFKARNNTYHVNIKVRFKKTVFSARRRLK
ncbi:hypothetical protein BSPWISOXPB_6397 [uncultured Gammaproteobacteria bacterium]|nr:hypothetical protein BSPWISOXPB_6397 [uncultured Gammaproteobacteria bacterium]